MRLLSIALLIVLLTMTVVAPASASENHECQHDMTSIDGLYHCIHHAVGMGYITNEGVANSLLAKVSAAQAAATRGQPEVAVNILRAFIDEVQAQAGVHIDPMHAAHMVTHAQMVISALSGQI